MGALETFLFNKVLTEASLVALVFAVFWWLERKERITITKEISVGLTAIAGALDLIKDRLK